MKGGEKEEKVFCPPPTPAIFFSSSSFVRNFFLWEARCRRGVGQRSTALHKKDIVLELMAGVGQFLNRTGKKYSAFCPCNIDFFLPPSFSAKPIKPAPLSTPLYHHHPGLEFVIS